MSAEAGAQELRAKLERAERERDVLEALIAYADALLAYRRARERERGAP